MSKDESEIFDVFAEYKKAVLATKGEKAALFMDSSTIEWYADALQDAIKLHRSDLNRVNLLRKFTIIRLRHELSKKELLAMTGKAIFAFAINKSMISRSTVEKARLARVEIDGDSAKAYISQNPKTPLFYFTKENETWKFALWKTFSVANMALERMVEDLEQTDEQFILDTIKALSKSEVNSKIFDGPLEQKQKPPPPSVPPV